MNQALQAATSSATTPLPPLEVSNESRSFGRRMKELRERRGVSHAEIAAASSQRVRAEHVRAIEEGEAEASDLDRRLIAHALGTRDDR